MDMTEFQNDLKNMSLNDALTKHNISLSDALKNIKKPITKSKKRHVEVYNADTYIQCRDCSNGFTWRYQYYTDGKIKAITNVSGRILKEKVLKKGLDWIVLDKDKARENGLL